MSFEIENHVLKRYIDEPDVTEIIIPDGVQEIGVECFMGSRLEKVTLPEGISCLNYRAFKNCRSLNSIHLPEGLTTIENSVFSGCHRLGYLQIPESLEHIGVFAFYGIGFMVFRLSGGLMRLHLEDVYENQNDTNLLKTFLCTQDITLFSQISDAGYRTAIAFYLVFSGQADEQITKYAKRAVTRTAKSYIDINAVNGLRDLLQTGFVTKKNIDKLIEYAIDKQAHEIYLILLEYKNQHIGFSEKRFRL